jgi:soluble lytic murein transglycosylase-like protein
MLTLAMIWLLGIPRGEAVIYSAEVARYAAQYQVDPLLVVAVIQAEGRGMVSAMAKSRTNDYGLMQLHVSVTTHRKYIGRETLLFDPRLNIKLGVKMLRMWRAYHQRSCTGDSHHWWAHYNQGTRVRNRRYGRKVARIYERLLAKFGGEV